MVISIEKLGSPSALSLFASAETIPALVAAGAILAVTAAVFTYSEFKNYKEKKHKEKIEVVNGLYALHLKQIVVPHAGKIHGFPPVFQLIDSKYQSMHFTPEQVKDIGSDVTHGSDIALASYRESVRSAIRKLKEYYFSRKDGDKVKTDDITAGVISYLLQMLDTKCLNFLGYDYDIAYLDAINKFITAYSSLNSGEKSQHFSRLAPVYAHLSIAKDKLEKHKEVLSLQETVAELKDSCVNHSDILIRALVKMIAKNNDTELANTVAHDELKEGILRQHYIQSELFGIELRSDEKIMLPDSIFQNWIKNLSSYYLKSLSIEMEQQDDTHYSTQDFFIFLDQAKALLGRKLFGRSKEKELVDNELKKIRKVFHESGNFISTRYNKLTQKFDLVSDPLQLIDRSLVMAKIAKLAHEIISLQYLCTHLLRSIQLLGNIYVNNPAHFCKIFNVLDQLCMLIQEDVRASKKSFRQLQEDNANNMQIEEKELFPNEIKSILDLVYAEIKDIGEQVKDCRQMAIKAIKPATVKSVNYEMLELATAISKMYFDENSNSLDQDDHVSTHSLSEMSIEIDEAEIPEKKNKGDLIEHLTSQIKKINSRILEIQKTELFHSKNYFKIYDALLVMHTKSITLIQEQSSKPERIDKANKTLKLTMSLADETLEFLNTPTPDRLAGTTRFFNKIHKQLNDKNNASFIDRHDNKVSGFIYSNLCSYGIFRTDTRRKMAVFEEACLKSTYS
ncbi:MAG: hypothetical protein P4L65_05495 [Legionella sp.]|nr:hypothetical protein [Legionella sp.]